MIPEGVDPALYFITDTALCGGPERVPHVVYEAVAGGAGIVQVRDKHADDAAFLALARACRDAVRRAEDALGRTAALVVNDRVGVAERLGLHVHVGQSDASLAVARRAVGPERMVGVSASTAEEVRAAAESGVADLVGIGPVWATPTKTDAAAPLGPEGLAALAGPARAAGLVAVGIGGIRADRLPLLRGAGVDGICVVSAIAASENPRAAARELRAAVVDEGVLAAAGSAAPAARSEGAAS
ncbi:thiamine phosphate synthase [Rothia sp. BD8]|uniref:thiamine phosphate synthase n=1 Tax=Rothia TaxID=32207 RepID=UPI00244B7137|nr:thiamine phosphate synthase [Rothia kristinae]WGH09262.1 thiamine phosphate synthase [Rothia kristinae]